MRFWVLCVTVCSLLLLPFSGSSTVLPDLHSMDNEESIIASAAKTIDDAHCESMAESMAEEHQLQPDQHTKAKMDCCDDTPDCLTKCPADCGHCVSSGHGCSAAAAALEFNHPVVMHDDAVSPLSHYSFILVKTSPPPIIA